MGSHPTLDQQQLAAEAHQLDPNHGHPAPDQHRNLDAEEVFYQLHPDRQPFHPPPGHDPHQHQQVLEDQQLRGWQVLAETHENHPTPPDQRAQTITDRAHPNPEHTFDLLNPEFGVPADRHHRIAHQDVQDREAGLALGTRVAVHDSRQNDPDPVIWQPGQDYRMADTLQAARTQPTRTRHGPERVGPER
jgi:hypothetical protein